jgi:branched-chain amino acid transport system permease protein
MSTTTRAPRGPVLAALPAIRQRFSMAVAAVLLTLVAIWLLVNFIKAPGSFTIVLLSGIRDGSIYALVALGYTLVYGIIELINFAHGDVFMWGNMITITLATTVFGLDGTQSWAVTIPLVIVVLFGSMAFCATLNVTIERLAYRPLRSAPRLAPLITAIGVSYILQDAAGAIYGFGSQSVEDVFPTQPLFHLGGTAFRAKSLIVILVTIPVLLALTYLVRSTKAGKAMRATAQDMEAARMLGIDVDRTIAFTFALGGALAGSAGVLYIMYFGTTRFDLGFRLGLYAFTAAVLGGIGSLPGAVIGGLLIGLIETMWSAYFSIDYKDVAAFSILAITLIFLPQGLLGRPEVEKV